MVPGPRRNEAREDAVQSMLTVMDGRTSDPCLLLYGWTWDHHLSWPHDYERVVCWRHRCRWMATGAPCSDTVLRHRCAEGGRAGDAWWALRPRRDPSTGMWDPHRPEPGCWRICVVKERRRGGLLRWRVEANPAQKEAMDGRWNLNILCYPHDLSLSLARPLPFPFPLLFSRW